MADTTRAAAALAAWGGDGLGLIAHLLAEVARYAEGEHVEPQRTVEDQQALDEFLKAMAPIGADAYLELNVFASERLEASAGRDALATAVALLTAVQMLATKICQVLERCDVPVPRRRSEIQPLVAAVTAEVNRRAAAAPGLDTLEH